MGKGEERRRKERRGEKGGEDVSMWMGRMWGRKNRVID